MTTILAQSEMSAEVTEAYKALLARLGRKSAVIPPEVLVNHVLGCVPGHEWPTRVEAMDALIRRLEASARDELRIKVRPADGRVLGLYETQRRGGAARPYRTLLHGVNPIDGQCDCPDYLRNSLGICKHLLTIISSVYAKPKVLKTACAEQASRQTRAATGLRWDPIRPLTEMGDWLERIAWLGAPDLKDASDEQAEVLKWFRRGDNGTWVIKRAFRDDPAKRLAQIEGLLRLFPRRAKEVRYDVALHALLSAERHRLKLTSERSLSRAQVRAACKGLKRNLYPYQRAGLERFLAEGRLLLADDMGLGKTAQAIACTHVLWNAMRIRRALIIAPASLKPQWAREWMQFSDLPVHVIDGLRPEREAIYGSTEEGIFISNYEQLIRDLDIIKAWNPDLVVLDEAQRIKNWATKTALSVKGLTPPYRLVLTGTPMENRIEELASIVEWVDDMALEPKWRLSSLHAIRADGKREVIGVRHLDTLRQRLSHCMLRRIRQDVLDQLPARTDTRVPIEMTPEQVEEHDALNQPIATLMARAQVRPLTHEEFLRLMTLFATQRVISNGLGQLQFVDVWPTIQARKPEENVIKRLSSPKLLELRQLVRQLVLDQGRKLVVFSQWRRMLTLAHWAVSDLLAESGLRAGFFTGQEGQKRRTQNIVEFHDDPSFRILFASDAGGVGLNLQHASNCVINLELPWNPAVLEQRIGRVYRLGQTKPIDVFNLVSEYGIEARIASIVGSKQAFFKGLFDGDSDAVQFEQSTSFLARMAKIYEPIVASTQDSGQSSDEAVDLGDLALDDEVADPFEPILEAADESQDAVARSPEPIEGSSSAGRPASNESDGVPRAAAAVQHAAMPSAGEVRQLFSQLTIRRSDEGRVMIEAPAEAAMTLSALFEGMASLLRESAPEPELGS
jgi:superfamily II DNA or RNA helicase